MADVNLRDRYRGALLGLAAGDALGTTLEFRSPGSFAPITDMVGGGPFHLKAGQWTDDTSMALCLAESLVECRGFDAIDQLRRYVRWSDHGHLSSNGKCFDIGNTVSAALSRFRRTGEPYCGSTDPSSAGNGSLMRLAPVPLAYARDVERAVTFAGASSCTTHGAAEAVDACRLYAAMIVAALDGMPRDVLLARNAFDHLFRNKPLAPKIASIAAGSYLHKHPPEIRGTGYVVQALEAALWAFATTETFQDGALAAVNLGDDADTTGAIFGQLAGAYYGATGIPSAWRSRLALFPLIEEFAERLYVFGQRPDLPAWSAPETQDGRPFGNAYWVRHGQLLAGEYPGHAETSEARAKVGQIVDAGVTYVVDLTEDGELVAYAHLLHEQAAKRGVKVVHRRLPIRDAGLPRSATEMAEILDTVDRAIGDGHVVYVHCWGGIGRTGTVVGCHLVRHGLSGDEALAALAHLWTHVDKRNRRPRSPETDPQHEYVRTWTEPAR